jgi:hypothetical protein
MKISLRVSVSTLLASFALGIAKDDLKLTLSAKSWYQAGYIAKSSDTLAGNYYYDHNYINSPGAQFTILSDIGENWQGAMGFGGNEIQSPQGRPSNAQSRPLFNEVGFRYYVTQAKLSYHYGEKASPLFLGTLGLFPFVYNPDMKSFGGYLTRGPVYPGLLYSEFEAKDVDPTVANTLGLNLRSNLGGFTYDLILKSETDVLPVFDFSLIAMAQYRYKRVFSLGFGVNFFRLIAMKPELTDLTDPSFKETMTTDQIKSPYYRKFVYVPIDTVRLNADGTYTTKSNQARDTASGEITPTATSGTDSMYLWASDDTTRLSHRGIKLMARGSISFKEMFGIERMGENDLKLYSEVAVIGWKNYPGIYENRSERIPVMVGFGIPTFKLLDECNVEVEWYGAKFRNDGYKLEKRSSPIPVSNSNQEYNRSADPSGGLLVEDAPVPGKKFSDYDVENMVEDNWKWSFYMSKTLQRYVKLSFQVANDHYHPWASDSPNAFDSKRYESAFTRLTDYYTMFKIGVAF